MSNLTYTIRNYQPKDFDKYVLLCGEAAELEPTGCDTSPQAITEYLGQPNYSPEQDLFIVEIDGDIAGYMDIKPELAIGRVILGCWIRPGHLRKGLATRLLSYSMRRAKKLGATVAHVNIAEDNVVAGRVLSGMGFSPVRRFLRLRLDITDARRSNIDQAALGCCYLQRGEEDKLTQIQNRAFTGTWGYNPNTVEEIIYRTNLSTYSPEDIVLTCEGNKVIGYCWTGTACGGGAAGKKGGQILMLGVDPDYRGKGVGKKILLAGLAHLRSRNFQVAELTVDSDNKAAWALYKSVGFKVRTGSLWYEKVIN
ncbi:GNAT family N-acetyltransferase [Chloroflexota bacterium]